MSLNQESPLFTQKLLGIYIVIQQLGNYRLLVAFWELHRLPHNECFLLNTLRMKFANWCQLAGASKLASINGHTEYKHQYKHDPFQLASLPGLPYFWSSVCNVFGIIHGSGTKCKPKNNKLGEAWEQDYFQCHLSLAVPQVYISNLLWRCYYCKHPLQIKQNNILKKSTIL